MTNNKSYIIKRILDIDPTQNSDELKKLKIIVLLKLIEDLKSKLVVEIYEPPNSLAVYCGCSV